MKFDYIKAVILDWAGTTVDFGSRAPVAALTRVFAESGVEITAPEARQDMGVLKKDQIRFLLAGDRVREAWTLAHGQPPSEADVERMFTEFLPKQTAILAEFSDPIDGVCDTVADWRSAGLRIGSTTGYTRALLDVVMETSARRGYSPDASVTPDQVGAGRPAPFMCYQNAILLQASPLHCFVKIGDTPSDIAEGRNAGMWTIGITRTGNEIGLSSEELEALPVDEQQTLEDRACSRLRAAQAHFLARSLPECTPFLVEIERRIFAGERP
jgi:phosphonoacetaldehyde hydrolase